MRTPGSTRLQTLFAWLFAASLVLAPLGATALAQEPDAPQAAEAATLREGYDFATRVLGDPWDMNAFTDVSQWINHAGTSNELVNINFANGLFSATAEGSYSEFYALFPGYEVGMIEEGTGIFTPISSSQYGCFYMAMKVDIPESGDFYYNIFWGEDRTNDWGGKPWGKTYGNKILRNTWKLYSMNLHTWPYQQNYTWNSRPLWQGLRVSPIFGRANTSFSIDWIRLTDCSPVNHTLSGLPSGEHAIWLGSGAPERQVLAVESFTPSGGSYTWDLQGIAPGTYNYYVKPANNPGTTVQQGQITVRSAPILKFNRPSPFSGEDYTTQAGNAWDMADSSDVVLTYCVDEWFDVGLLYLNTLPPSALPRDCVGGGANEADPIVYLNTPVAGNLSAYRYLSLRHKIDGTWSQPERGMVIRWIWGVDHSNPYDCYYVSREIALDVGWDTYWVDLHNLFNGTPIEVGYPTCPQGVPWSSQTGVTFQFRLDPNENITSGTFHQEIDWIRLTKVDQVRKGEVFPIQVESSTPFSQLTGITFYYTTDPAGAPTQHVAQLYNPTPPPSRPNKAYLPFMGVNRDGLSLGGNTYNWNTSSVAPGTYYICAAAQDGLNQVNYCSRAPVQVLAP
jgi:hypothetical protein